MDIKHLEDAIFAIGKDIFHSTDGVEYFDLVLKTNGAVQLIEFVGIPLWDSENSNDSDRLLPDGSMESIEAHLRRVLRRELDLLKLIVV